MKPGNLFESGANIGSKSKLDDERETRNVMYSLELFRRVHFFVLIHNKEAVRWQIHSYFHQSQ